MLGKYDIHIKYKKISYKFTINRNITIIKGDSGTGKTSLIRLIESFNNKEGYVDIIADIDCITMNDSNWESFIKTKNKVIFFIDENNNFYKTHDFARYINEGNDNYFVIITREILGSLNYSYKEIYKIHNSGKYNYLKNYIDYNNDIIGDKYIIPKNIIVEDSNSGYQFFKNINKDTFSAEGKSKIIKLIKNNVLIIADGAAFGNEIENLLKEIKIMKIKLSIYLPESFEYILLKSNFINDNELNLKLDSLYNYVDSLYFSSYERFLYRLITDITKNTKFSYDKSKINEIFLTNKYKNKILEVIPFNIENIKINNNELSCNSLDWS